MFIPTGDNIQQRSFPLIPCVLIVLNVLAYAYQCRLAAAVPEGLKAEVEFLETWGLVPAELQEGQVLGLLTHMFLHGGPMHLAGNMMVLWAFAASLEAGLGSLYLLAFYMLWGLLAGLAHVGANLGDPIPMIGASGAIAGLIGAYTVLFGASAQIKGIFFLGFYGFRIQIPATVFGLSWIGFQLWDAASDPEGMSGVAWYAHIGGFIAGAITMYFFRDLVDYKLEHSLDGEPVLVVKDAPQPVEEVPAFAKPAPAEDSPDACPYCRTPLEQAVTLAPGLLRCGNEGCERLVYSAEAVTG